MPSPLLYTSILVYKYTQSPENVKLESPHIPHSHVGIADDAKDSNIGRLNLRESLSLPPPRGFDLATYLLRGFPQRVATELFDNPYATVRREHQHD